MKSLLFHLRSRNLFAAAGILLSAGLFLAACGSSPSEAQPSSAAPTQAATAAPAEPTDSDTRFTLLMYMIGSDLESVDGAASSDISEILAAKPSHGLRVLLQTGGAERWYTDGIREDILQRHDLTGGTLTLLEEVPQTQTSLPETLHDFLSWGIEQAPADRYGVILWDHGGGATLGYGQDDYYPEESLSLAELHTAFEGLGVHFDFIGFDACLMGTMETALAFSPYADYLLASEEFEPSTGWFYTDWIRTLDADPDIPAKDLGISIVDDFVSEKNAGPYDFCTLALVDLQKIPDLYNDVREWYHGYYNTFDAQFAELSKRRSLVKSFGGGNYEQVDLMDLLESSDSVPDELIKKASEAIIHAAHNKPVDIAAGLSLYYPYLHPEKYDPTAGSMTQTGFETDYFAYYDSFVTTIEYMQMQRAKKEERHDALGLVEAAGLLDSGTESAGGETAQDAPESEPPALDPEEVRFREYIKIHNLTPEEEELVSDVRLLQLNPVDSGYIYVGKEGSGPILNGTDTYLSGGQYLAIDDTLVSFELVYDSEYPKDTGPTPVPGPGEENEKEPEGIPGGGEEETTRSEENEVESEAENKAEEEATQAALSEEEAGEEETTRAETGNEEEGESTEGDSEGLSTSTFSGSFPDFDFSPSAFSMSVARLVVDDALGANEDGEVEENDEPEVSGHDRDWFRYGYVDAVLNGGQYVDLMVCWDYEHPDGIVAGYRPIPEEAIPFESDYLYMPHRGLKELKEGDELQFYFHHFDENGISDGIVFLDDPIVIGKESPEVDHCRKPFQHMKPGTFVAFVDDLVLLGEGDAIIAYRITDVYNNIYYVKAYDAWDPEDIVRIDPDHPEEAWPEVARRLGIEPSETPPDGNGPTAAPPVPDTSAQNANTPAPAAPAQPAPPQAADNTPAVTETQPAQETAQPAGSYTVIGTPAQEASPNTLPPEEYSDDEIEAFFNSELEDEEDDEPVEETEAPRATQAETRAPETQAQTQAETPAATEAQTPAATVAQTQAETRVPETEAEPAAAPAVADPEPADYADDGGDGYDDPLGFDDQLEFLFGE